MAIEHTVVFRLQHAGGSDAEADFLSAARSTLAGIPGVEEFAVMRQIGAQSDMAWQFRMRFADQAAYDAYTSHADHVGFVSSRWRGEVAAFQEYDFTDA
jgi:hypothetical protein